jgi:uncharacterized membrane protein YhaH (DUF805 family)
MEIIGPIIGIAFLVFFVWLYVRIVQKAGYSGWWVLTLIIPLVNFIMIYVFAFSDWPALKKRAA